MTSAGVRRIALALPGSEEKDHHGFPSFRIGGKIFASLPDARHLHVMIAEDAVAMATSVSPDTCEELWWGKKLAGIRVTLKDADEAFVSDLLREAWSRKQPRGRVSGSRPLPDASPQD